MIVAPSGYGQVNPSFCALDKRNCAPADTVDTRFPDRAAGDEQRLLGAHSRA